ncbi:hypothetical protein [Paenibacillus protaetiae]|uniref:Uncharacterized protein n=1 Tax=Paenibacillus protaetiae TaxID=2509456 RepID=A0A4P6F8M1_9BACL|nr:hypothetical protein [Paenibacillus protaetiae]QAY66798.1 hypothetical protein ET464_10635 [Paenibacillus protaetiae]
MRKLASSVIALLLGILFYRVANFRFSEEEVRLYEQLYAQALHSKEGIQMPASVSKARFLQYIAYTKPVVLHGTNRPDIATFEPRRQTLYNGTYTEAVFAAKDGIFVLFYAVLDRSKVLYNMRNACFHTGTRRYYYFSLTLETVRNYPWTNGTVYVLPQEPFTFAAAGKLAAFEEWVSSSPVEPLAKINVEPADFVFRNRVAAHPHAEHPVVSWLLYKRRVKRMKLPVGDDLV